MAFENQLLALLRPEDMVLFNGAMHLTQLQPGDVLEASNSDITDVFFIESGVVSVNAITSSGVSVQIAMIGREGVTGTSLVLGERQWPHSTTVVVGGMAWCIEAEKFEWLISKNYRFRNMLLRYTGILARQMASAALANGRSTVPERLARWILMMHKRVAGNTIDVTHDEIADLLGVRRPGITNALHILEGDHVVRSERGRITVLDSDGLKTAAAGSYRDGD